MAISCLHDCYDGCDTTTAPYLCEAYNNLSRLPHLTPTPNGLEQTIATLKTTPPEKVLFLKGSGNFGKLSHATVEFFSRYGASFVGGSLCDGAGEAAILAGRGSNKHLSLTQIQNAQTIILWGRDASTTNTHLLPHLAGKNLIVIDPIKTKIAQKATLHLPINPRTDLYLAMLLIRFSVIENLIDEPFVQAHVEGFEELYELSQQFRIKESLKLIGIDLPTLGLVLHYLSMPTVILMGLGVQKHLNGYETVRAIDSLGAILGLFGKSDRGVGFLADSSSYLSSPFATPKPKEHKANINFTPYDVIFVQNTNLLHSYPNQSRIRHELAGKIIINFGLFSNATSESATINLLGCDNHAKEELRTSYYLDTLNHSIGDKTCDGMSENGLNRALCKAFDWETKGLGVGDFAPIAHESIAYQHGFDTPDGKFQLLDTIEEDLLGGEGLMFITKKHKKSINSAILSQAIAYFSTDFELPNGTQIVLYSSYGEAIFAVEKSESVPSGAVLLYSNTPNINHLTPNLCSEFGDNAVFEEVKIGYRALKN